MRRSVVVLAGLAALGFAQLVRGQANELRGPPVRDDPYAPSQEAARVVSLGYNELSADLLFFRLVGYFGDFKHTADGVASLVEAIATVDPHHRKIYVWGSQAMVHALGKGVGRQHFLRAIALLEKGMKEFPDDYELPKLAGEIYVLDLVTDDPVERRRWDDKGASLIETAVRKPGAPADLATFAAILRTKLGQRQRAIDSLQELLLITNDTAAREEILKKLEELKGQDSAEIASEIYEQRKRFETAWIGDRPYLSPSLWIQLGTRSQVGVDMTDLATGGHDLVDLGEAK